MQANVLEGFRLSPQQQRLWRLTRATSLPYHVRGEVAIAGDLDPVVLRQAVGAAVARHESLRISFAILPGMELPLQVAGEEAKILWEPDRDLTGEEAELQQDVVDSFYRETPAFDLGGRLPVRALLVRLAADRHVLLLGLSALCADAASLDWLMADVATLYRGNEPSEVLQYIDVSEWQHETLASAETESMRHQWRRQSLAEEWDLALPFERQVVRSGEFDPASTAVPFAPDLTARLAALGSQASPSDLFLACWELLLARLTGRYELTLGVAVDGRTYEGLNGVVGPLTKVLPVRARVEPKRRFRDLLESVRGAVADARERQEFFSWEEHEVAAGGEPPFLPFGFSCEERGRVHSAGPVSFTLTRARARFDRFRVLLACRTGGDAPSADLHYDRCTLDSTQAGRLAYELAALVARALNRLDAGVHELDLLGVAERQQVLRDFNDTARALPADCLHRLVEEQVARTPDRLAASFENAELSYAELNRQSDRMAHRLRRLGVGPEVVVAVHLERSLELLVAILGILKAGGAYLPLDPEYPPDRLAYMLADARPAVVLTSSEMGAIAAGPGQEVIVVDREDPPTAEDAEDVDIVSGAAAESPAYIIYTSGSTGRPKGVVIPHAGIVNRLLWMLHAFPVSADDRILQKTAFSFDASVWEMFLPLLAGAGLVIAQPGGQRDSAYLAVEIARREITVLQLVPSMLRVFLEEPGLAACTALRRLFCGGESLPRELQQRFFARSTAELHILYGPTEASIDVSSWLCRHEDGEKQVRIGCPIANTRIYLLDSELLQVGLEVPGELYAGGPGLARGYFGRPDLTADRFVPDPFATVPGARLYRTGDLARWLPEGSLAFLRRVDHQVKVRGFRIELGEIEAVLEALPSVRAAVAAVREDTSNTLQIVAYVVPVTGQAPAIEELRERLRSRLPEFMVPNAVVMLDVLPLTPSGKLDRAALPAPGLAATAGTSVAPRTPLEELVAGIFAEVLGIERVGAEDDFFDLGGHSLLASQVTTRVRQVLGAEVSLRRLFEKPRVAELAAEVESALRDATESGDEISPLVRAERGETLPLSFAQQRLWFLDQLAPGSPAYNLPLPVRLRGRLDASALLTSLASVVRRHETLRATFPLIEGKPVLRIGAPGDWVLPRVDLVDLPETRREIEAERLLVADTLRSFDLGQGPLLRTALVSLAESDHLIVATVHHIVSDGWSTGVLVRELSIFYRSLVEGTLPLLPELPVQYADFAIWQRNWLSGAVLERQLAWWRASLEGAPAVLELPTDHPRPPVQSYRGGEENVELPAPLAAAILRCSRRHGVTPFMTLLAGFATLLGRYSGQRDLVVGSPVANRTRLEVEGLIGLFVNTLALRSDLRGDASGLSFGDLLKRVRNTALGAYAHQDLPFEKLVEELAPQRDMSRSPLFQAMLVVQNAPNAGLALPGLELSTVTVRSGTTKFDLLLTLTEGEERISGPLSYSRDLFDAATAARLASHLRNLLEAAVEDPGRSLSALPILTRTEQEQLAGWNATRVDYPAASACLHHLIAEQVDRTPEAIAVVAAEGLLTYGELNARAGRLAGELGRLGIGPENVVGLCAERSLAMIVGLLGILEAGAAYLPLDPAYPQERLAALLVDARVPVILVGEGLRERLPAQDARIVSLDPLSFAVSGAGPAAVPEPDNLAYVIFTSGSTGRPKGVMNSHRGIVNRLLWMQEAYGLTAEDRVLQKTLCGFDVSVWELFWPLLTGACLVMAEPGGHQDPEYLARIIEAEGITTLHFVPSMLRAFLDEPATGRLTSLVRVIASGEALSNELRQRFFLSLGRSGTGLHNLYGPTEAAVDVTFWDCSRETADGGVPIGHPVANTAIHLLAPDLCQVPVGVPGELYIGGVQLARGYLGRPDLTSERFLPDPFAEQPGGRLYRTGDLARRLPDGALDYLGRTDDQVKVRGVRVELGEIEMVLASHPALREAAVTVWNERGDVRLVAYVVPASAPEPLELRDWLGKRLPEAFIPFAFLTVPALPLSPNGKLDRRALAGRGVAVVEKTAEIGEAPRTAIEILLAGIWSEVLGLERVGLRQSFFELGGHSLLATQVMSRLRRVFAVELPLRRLFEAPTVGGLATAIAAALAGGEGATPLPPIVRAERRGELALSHAQQRLWFLEQLKGGRPILNIPAAVRFRGRLDAVLLARVMAAIVARHESLRTSFPAVDGRAHQVIHPSAPPALRQIDLTGLPDSFRGSEMQRILAEEARRAFDLTQGPLLRTTLIRLAGDDQVLSLVLHHLVSDGWSVGVMVRELTELYQAFSQGQPSPLAELPIQYADFAAWQRGWASGPSAAPHLSYWKEQLAGRLPLVTLPADRQHPETPSHRGTTRPVRLSRELTDGLEALGRRLDTTLFMTLLTGFQAWLHLYSGQDDIVVGADVANRNRAETESLIGFFVNQLVLRTDLSGDPTWEDLLGRVREVSLQAFQHQDLPFDQLVEALKIERSLKYAPLFQVKLIYQNAPLPDLALPDLSLTALDVDAGTAQLDFTLALWRTEEGLSGWYNYNTDLFESATIERLLGDFTQILEHLIARSAARLSELTPFLDEKKRKDRTMEADKLGRDSFQKFKSIKPKVVSLPQEQSLVRTGFLKEGTTLPLVIEPAVADTDVVEWLGQNKSWIEGRLHQHGALLLRGFNVDSVRKFEQLSLTFCQELYSENGEHQMISGNVATPVFYPPDQKLLWHNENSFNYSWPMRILFCCKEAPALGGETPIVDSRQVFARLDPQIRDKFATRQVMYQRNYGGGLGLDWQTVFRTEDRAAVEADCRASRFDFQWKPNGQLRTTCVRPAVVRHPVTGEMTWFNQAQHWHISCLDPATRASLTSLFVDEDLPRNCYYGDGSRIEDAEMAAILDLYRELEVSSPWQPGDVMVLDNLLVAHARNPFEGTRKILVTLGDMKNYDEL